MPSDKERLTFKDLIRKILEPHPGIKGISSRQQSSFTTLASFVLATVGLLASIITIAVGANIGLIIGFASLTIVMAIACVLGRSENFLAGGVILVSGLIVVGFIFSAAIPNDNIATGILLITIVPALFISILLLPLVAVIIISVVKLLTIGTLPLMGVLNPNTGGILLLVSFIIIDSVVIITIIFRDNIDNQQLEELENLQVRLDERVEERTRYTRIVADIAHEVAMSPTLEELLNQAASLTVSRLYFSYAGIYLSDETERHTILKAAQGLGAAKMLQDGRHIESGSQTLVGWVMENRQQRVLSKAEEESLQFEAELLPQSQSAIGVPIISRGRLLGVMDIQSARSYAFTNEVIVMLQMLADHIATSIQNVQLFAAERAGIREIIEVYLTSYRISQAKTEDEIYQAIQELFPKSSYIAMLLTPDENVFRVIAKTGPDSTGGHPLPELVSVSKEDLRSFIATDVFIGEGNRLNSLPYEMVRLLRQLDIYSLALVPVMNNNEITAILFIGTQEKQPLEAANIQPYNNLAKQIAISLNHISETQKIERRIAEMETVTSVSQEISTIRDLSALYQMLHTHIRQALGDVNFWIAIYDASTNSVAVPYMYEKGLGGDDISTVESFPLGEGLTSLLIRTRQPLMLVEDTEKRATALGAKTGGKSAKSWLGTPLIVSGEVIGAIVVQDMEHEHAFDDADMRFLTTLSAQVAGAIYNTRLLEETASRAVQLQTAAEIARDISGSLDLSELLNRAVTLFCERFDFYHASVFLLDASNEFAIIREATGEAGMQMKRAGHKLKIGSKSIVGYVVGSGEPLIVNDTSRDATFYANPLLPETRAEAALPLKIGAHVLGALDVQSTQAYSFSEEDVNVLRILADQLAIAVINSELFADTQEHLSQHRLLHHVTTAAASGTTIEEALTSAAQGLQVTLGGDRVIILLADKDKRVLKIKAFAGYSEEVGQIQIPYDEGITGWVAVHQQPQRVNDVTQDPRYFEIGSNVRSELAIPLLYRGELLGVLNVESDQVGAYNENDEEMLGTLGGSLAAIIANARLIEQVRHQVDRERMLYEVTSKIRRSTDRRTIMAVTTAELSKALGARRTHIRIGAIQPEAEPDKQQKKVVPPSGESA